MVVPIVFKKPIDMEKTEVKIGFVPITNEEYILETSGGIRFFDIHQFLTRGLDGYVETFKNDDLKFFKEILPVNWNLSSKKLAYPH